MSVKNTHTDTQKKKDVYGIFGAKEWSTSKVGEDGDASRTNHLGNFEDFDWIGIFGMNC